MDWWGVGGQKGVTSHMCDIVKHRSSCILAVEYSFSKCITIELSVFVHGYQEFEKL